MRRPRFLSPQERVKSPVNHHVIQLPRKQTMLLQIGPYVYDCTCVIGKGQYSVVYRGCEQNKPTNLVAVKVITIQPNNPIQMYMIENEINILKQLDNPYILKMLHHQQINKNVFIVTEYCNKGDLLQKIQRSLIPEEEAILFTLQIAKALQVIHSNNISINDSKLVHGDIKSANIFLSDHCTLGDFGFAQKIDQAQQTFIIGTPLYMAPEVLFENEINCQADMWSLGCVLYEMVYGQSPFYSENNEILKATLAEFREHGKLTFPNTGVSRKIQALILYLIKVDPKERLSAADTVQLLEPRSVDEQIKINGDQLKIRQELMNLDNKSVVQQPSQTQLPPTDNQSNTPTNKQEAGTPTHEKQPITNNNNHSPEEHRRSTKNSNSSAKRKLLQNINQKVVTQVTNTQHTQTSDKKVSQRNSQPTQQPSNSKPISLLDLVNYFYKVYQLIMNAKELKLAFIYLKLVNIYYMAYLEEQSKQQKKVVFYSCQNDYFELEREIKNKYPQWLKEEEFQKIFHCKFTLTQDFLRHSLNYINRAVAEQQHDQSVGEKIKKTLQILTVLGSNEKSSTLQLDQQIIRLHRLNSKV